MDIDTQGLTKTQHINASRYQKIQQATLSDNLRGLSAEFHLLQHGRAGEEARLRLKADSLQELASRGPSGTQRLSPQDTIPSRSPNSLYASSRRLSVSMSDLDQATQVGLSGAHPEPRSRSVAPASVRSSSDTRTSRTADVTTNRRRSPRGGATMTVPRLQVSPASDEKYEALKKCRYLRVRGLDDEELSPEEVFSSGTSAKLVT